MESKKTEGFQNGIQFNNEVTLILRNKDTHEVEYEEKVINIANYNMYFRMLPANSSNGNAGGYSIPLSDGVHLIRTASKILPKNFFYTNTSYITMNPAIGYTPSGGSNFIYTPFTLTDPSSLLMQKRFDPPALGTSVTINTILLSAENDSSSPIAYTPLDATCTQTDSQYLDIFYKVTFLYDPTKTSLSRDMYYHYVDIVTRQHYRTGLSYVGAVARSSPSKNTYNSEIIPYTWNSGQVYATGTNKFLKTVYSHSLSKTDQVGGLYKEVYPVDNDMVTRFGLGSFPLYKAGQTTVQPVHGHKSTATLPFLDASNFAQGTGKVVPVSTTEPDGLDSYYFIDITNSGNAGTATYKFRRRPLVGFVGNTYQEASNRGLFAGTRIKIGQDKFYHSIGNIKGFFHPSITETWRTTSTQGLPKLAASGDSYNVVYGPMPINASSIDPYVWFMRVRNVEACGIQQDGMSLYHCGKNTYKTLDATTSPALPVTKIYQVHIDAITGEFYVACSQTGLWKINSTWTTVTQITTPATSDLTRCYGVQANNSEIFAVYSDGLFRSTNAGSSWVKYDGASSPVCDINYNGNMVFNQTRGLRVDFASANRNMLFVKAYMDQTLAEGHNDHKKFRGVWWSLLGTPTWIDYLHIGLTTKRPIMPNLIGADSIGIVDGKFYIQGWSGSYYSAFGQGGSNYSGQALYISEVVFGATTTARSISVPGVTGPISQFQSYNHGGDIRAVVLNQWQDRIVSLVTFGTSATYLSTAIDYTNSFSCNGFYAVFLKNNLVMNFSGGAYGSADVGSSTQWNVCSLTKGNNTVNGTAPWIDMIQESYGWDGSNWVLGHSGSKVVHLTSEPLMDGVNISFQNGGAGTSFVNTDYYTFGHCLGILKDNATTMSYSYSTYSAPLVKDVIQAGTIGLANYATKFTGVKGNVIGYAGVSGSFFRNTDGSYSVTTLGAANILQAFARTCNFIDCFRVSMEIDTNTSGNFKVGLFNVGIAGRASISVSGSVGSGFTFSSDIDFNYGSSTVSHGSCAVGDILSLERLGSNTLIKKNGTTIRTISETYTNEMGVGIMGLGTNQLSRTPVIYVGASSPTIYGAKLGNQGSETHTFSKHFAELDVDHPGTLNEVLIDGSPATLIFSETTAPGLGEIVISRSGEVRFNSGDSGKTYSIKYAYISTEGIDQL